MPEPQGFDRGLTNYGDRDFALYPAPLLRALHGRVAELLSKPMVGIAMPPSGFNNCHRYMPELVDAVSRGVLAAGALAAARSRPFRWARCSSIPPA